MNRRTFLLSCIHKAACGWLALSGFSRSLAADSDQRPCPARIALIIDDIGYSRAIAEQFLSIDIPMTYAVLPRLRHSIGLSTRVNACGHEIMLHQPMEPMNPTIDPGPGALYVGSEGREIGQMVADNLGWVPHAVGVNNHMGSRFTQTVAGMAATMGVVRNNSLYFVDSLTSYRSVAYQIARRFGIPSTRRSVFLDNVRQEEAVIRQLRALVRQARHWGRAVGIGHPFPETARAIARFCRSDSTKNCTWAYASGVIEPEGRPQVTAGAS